MRITFIQPAIGKKKGEKYIGTWKMEPLTIALLNALTPPDVETSFFDDRIEPIDYNIKTDLVAITVETYTAKRSYQIAQIFRQKGVPVIMGGYHPTLLPDEASEHADSICVGNADTIWHTIINDLQNGSLKKTYYGESKFTNIIPDRTIFKGKKYLPLSLVETGRGCKFKCTFCAIAAYHNSTYVAKSIDLIVKEIKTLKHKAIFFCDDNIVADPAYALVLFKAITPLKIKWFGQGTLNMAKDKELLKWIKKSGGELMLIGFESLEEKNLEQMDKKWRRNIGEENQLVRNIHNAGIEIYATFVFGFDYDTKQSIDNAFEFAKKHSFYIAAFNHLLPFPGTPFYNQLEKEGKFISDKWWLNSKSNYGEIVFNPKQMDSKELAEYCLKTRQKYFTFSQILKRAYILLTRKPAWFLFINHWFIGLSMKREVHQKYGLPIGRGLDETIR